MMSRRLGGLLSLAATSGLLVLAALILAGTPTQATSYGSAALPAAPGVWADIAPFPTVTVSPTPGTQLLHIKRAASACYAPNGNCYVLGGRHGTDGQDTALRWIWEYAPGPNTWTRKNALLDGSAQGAIYGSNMAAAVLTDATGTRIYAIGGNSIDSVPTNTVRIYNPVADSLSTLTTDPWPASPVRVPGGWAVYNNNLYIFGGFSSLANGGTGGVFTDTWKFDPQAPAGSRWTQLANGNLGLGRGYIGGAALDGYLYAIGGDLWNGANPPSTQLIPVTNVERMDVRTPGNPWVAVAGLPTARGDLGAWAYDTGKGYTIAGKIAVAGGHYEVPDAQGYLYTPGAPGSWATFPNMVHATRDYAFGQLNGFLYAFGGYDYTNNLPDAANWNQRYDATVPSPTPTATATAAPVLVGHVTWQGRPAQPHALNQLPISLTLQLGSTVTNYPNRQTDASGFFTVTVGALPSGTYNWWAKGPRWLASSGTVSLSGAPSTQQEMGLQRAGDVNNDNLVDTLDSTLLRATFGLVCGNPGYDDRADFTGDCLVDTIDFTWLRGNFGQAGPPQPTMPGSRPPAPAFPGLPPVTRRP